MFDSPPASIAALALIYVFHGDDTFSANEALAELAEAVGPPDLRALNTSRFDAGGFSVNAFLAAAMVVPFLAERRLVVVHGLLEAVAGPGSGGRRGRRPPGEGLGAAAGLPQALANTPDFTDAVFLDAKVTQGNPLLREIQALGEERVQVRSFPPLRRDDLKQWVRERAARKGARLSPNAVDLLAEYVGPNLWAMDNELEKLAIYRSGGEMVEASDVEALTASLRESSVFDLVDMLMEGRGDRAMAKLQALLTEGAGGPYLVSMVARQARLTALGQELLRLGTPRDQWGQRLGVASDFVVRKTADQARRFPAQSIGALYRLLVEADMAMKSGERPEEVVLVELVARASSLRSAH